jgi:hypothetical protein
MAAIPVDEAYYERQSILQKEHNFDALELPPAFGYSLIAV